MSTACSSSLPALSALRSFGNSLVRQSLFTVRGGPSLVLVNGRDRMVVPSLTKYKLTPHVMLLVLASATSASRLKRSAMGLP